jgi:putative beta-lysine N-acetyltransferase
MADIYRNVFTTYPFPVYDPSYLWDTMQRNIDYYVVEVKGGNLVALSSAEIDSSAQNAEMTDFPTHPDHTGNNLSNLLLRQMEKQMKQQGINTLYTIARLISIPMNKTFLKNEYQYSGTLIKNTNIAGNIESMNIYYKQI